MIEQIEAPDDRILQEDLEYLAGRHDFSGIFHSSVLVTGATGLLGSQLIKLFLCLNRTRNAVITIYAFIRDEAKARKIFGALYEKINFVIGDIKTVQHIDCSIDYIIHGASETASKTFIEKPVETIDTAYTGTRTMLEFAKAGKVKGFVYLSSMEVFGITGSREISENDYGYIDILNPRSSYSESKRMCECLCACYAAEYSVPVKIARLVQAVGAGVDYNDTRVAAQFTRSVIENKDIVLKTEGKTRRPCIYTRDAIAGICTVLLKGSAGEAYSVANVDTTATIRETAEMIVEKIAGNNIKMLFDIDVPAEYVPNLNINLNLKLDRIKSLGWKAEVGLEEAYRRMIESMRERDTY
jgi:nucleoside-diphosphate-sugar epimerase